MHYPDAISLTIGEMLSSEEKFQVLIPRLAYLHITIRSGKIIMITQLPVSSWQLIGSG
jgi:hypothetical protein